MSLWMGVQTLPVYGCPACETSLGNHCKLGLRDHLPKKLLARWKFGEVRVGRDVGFPAGEIPCAHTGRGSQLGARNHAMYIGVFPERAES